MNVNEYIDYETKRQSGTPSEAEGMYHAWMDACEVEGITEAVLCRWAGLIKGDPFMWYRRVPVTFRHGGHAVNHEQVPHAMEALIQALDMPWEDEIPLNAGVSVVARHEDVFTKEFLVIHPFTDGNGRVGSLFWNYLRGSLHAPEPMPFFFGEDRS